MTTSERSDRRSVRREAIHQAVAAGGLQVGLRAAAIGAARGVRGIPGFRGLVVAQAEPVDMSEHGRTLRTACPVLAGAVVGACERGAVSLRSRQRVVAVRRVAKAVDDVALLGERGLLG